MRRVLAQFFPLIVILIVLASIIQVFAATEKSAGDKLSVWDRFLIAIGLREKPVAAEAREFEYIPGRLQQPTAPNYQLPTTNYQTPASPPAGEPKNLPPLPPSPPLQPSALGVKTESDSLKTTNTISGFLGSIWKSITSDLGLSKPPKPPIPPVLPASTRPSSLGGPKTLGVQDQQPATSNQLPIPPLPPLPPIPPRAP